MYIRKYFTGTSTNATKTTTFGANTTSVTVYSDKSNVIGRAVEYILKKAGLTNAYYDSNKFLIYPDRNHGFCFGFYMSAAERMTKIVPSMNFTTNFSTNSSSGANYQPFSGLNYRFYVSLLGDVKTGFNILIGNYTTPDATNSGLVLARIKDISNGNDMWGCQNLSSMYIRDLEGNSITTSTHSFARHFSGSDDDCGYINITNTTGRFYAPDIFTKVNSGSGGPLMFKTLKNEDGEEELFYTPQVGFFIKVYS